MKPVTVESLGDGPVTITVESLLSEAVTVSGSAPGHRVHARRGHHHAQRPRGGRAAAHQSDAGDRERRRRQPGVRRPGRGARRARAGARPHADPDRRRAGDLGAPRRAKRHLSGSEHRRGRGRGPWTRLGRLRVGRVWRRHLDPHAARDAGHAPRGPLCRNGRHGHPGPPAHRPDLQGPAGGQRALRRPHPRGRRLGQPRGRGLQLGLQRSRLPRPRRAAGRHRDDQRRLAERLRPRHRAAAQQLPHRPLLLPVRELASLHRVVRGARRRRLQAAAREHLLRHLRPAHRPGPLRHRHHRPQHRARRYRGQGLRRARLRRASAGTGPRRDGRGPERPLRTRGPGRADHLRPGR